MSKQNGMKRYLRAVQSLLLGKRAQRRAALAQIRLVLQELPNIEALTAEEISALTGTPAEMVADYTEQRVETILQRRYKMNLIYAAFAVFLVLALAATAIFCVQNGAALQGYDGYRMIKFTPEEQLVLEEQQRFEAERAYYEKIGREAMEGQRDFGDE